MKGVLMLRWEKMAATLLFTQRIQQREKKNIYYSGKIKQAFSYPQIILRIEYVGSCYLPKEK